MKTVITAANSLGSDGVGSAVISPVDTYSKVPSFENEVTKSVLGAYNRVSTPVASCGLHYA